VLEAMKRDSDGVFTAFVRDRSAATRAELLGLDLPRSELEAFQALASQSADEQFRLEVADALSFEVWRRSYLAPETLQV
jgi:hypothetical protein